MTPADTSTVSLRSSTSGLGRALAVVDFVARHSPDPVGVSMVARELDLPKAVAHRILKELSANRFLSFDESIKQYRLGSGALSVGLAALRGVDVPSVAKRYMHSLVEETGETTTLSVRQQWTRVYIDQIISPHEIHMSVSLGSRHSLHAGSSSKAILAALDDQEIDDFIALHRLTRLTSSTVTTAGDLREQVAVVRENGYAVSLGERQVGAASVAAPVRRASGEVFGSLSICGPADRFSDEQLSAYGALVHRAASDVSSELGFAGALFDPS